MSQEDGEIYKRINLYYDIADRLKSEILNLEGVSEEERFDILMPAVNKIRKTADELMEKYVYFLKNNDSSIGNEIVDILDKFLEYLSIYKAKLYELYNSKDNNNSE